MVKAGKQLMKHKMGEDKAVLKKKLQNLEKEWEKVCQVSVDRQDRLEDAYRKIGIFRYLSYRLTRNMPEIQFDRLLGQKLVIVISTLS